MDVYLLPVGRQGHELYCEIQGGDAAAVEGDAGRRTGWLARQVARFREMLAEAEAERDRIARGEAPSRRGGIGRWVMRKLAETIAEQRLLWHIGRVDEAVLTHPSDLPGGEALVIARRQFDADAGKHRRWAFIDAAITAVTGPLFFFVPGPNLISWYFAFRAVGHVYALRGARHASRRIHWTAAPSRDLTAVREALALDVRARRDRLTQIAASLGLSALPGFVERVARRPS